MEQTFTTARGLELGNRSGDRVGFAGTAPVAMPVASASQAAVTTTSVAVAATASTSTTPFGYAQAQADAIVTNLNAAVVDIGHLATLVNQLRSDLVSTGLLKGSA